MWRHAETTGTSQRCSTPPCPYNSLTFEAVTVTWPLFVNLLVLVMCMLILTLQF